MSTPKFTPGPWRFNGDIVAVSGEFIADLFDNPQGNGPLIATAPEMYEALSYFHDSPSLSSEVLSRFATMCHKALAKAEGRQP